MTDRWTYRLIAASLCVALLGGLGTLCYLAATGREIPALLAAIVTGIVGNVTPSILSKAKSDEPTDVTVTNPPGEPIPVEEVAP